MLKLFRSFSLVSSVWFLPITIAVASTVLLTSGARAQVPFSFDVDQFEVNGRLVVDDFNDGVLAPQWVSTIGNVSESGGVLTISSPGAGGFLGPDLSTEASGPSGFSVGIADFGNFSSFSIWGSDVPSLSQGINHSLGSLDLLTGEVHQYSVGLSNTTAGVANLLGGDSGLAISILDVIRDAPNGNILSLTRTTVSVLAVDITGPIVFGMNFDDLTDTLNPFYSLDGGTTILSPFPDRPWSFGGGQFALSASSVVPEPGTAVLFGMGLVGLCVGRRGA